MCYFICIGYVFFSLLYFDLVFFVFLGLLSIDMFCDHYSLVSSSLTSFQLNACYSYYQNDFHQPWYTSLITLVPIAIGAIIMVRNIKRTIYDTLSVPVFLSVVGIFLFRIKKYIELLAVETQASDGAKEEYLKQIAYSHVIMGVLLVLLLILQALAERKVKVLVKKNL
jgi:undecaprenyl pyrophosphate phosphatase UppP